MHSVKHLAQTERQAETLVILLPGALHGPEDFLREGFADAVQARGLAIDLQFAELQFEQVAGEQALPQLHTELVEPALTAGYSQLWLAGISIGGYVAMSYADRYPGHVHGLLLMAPYPGNRMTTGEIAKAGGLAGWQPGELVEDDTERRNWQWLKSQQGTEIHLGYGTEDRFADGHAMMAAVIPQAHVNRVPGGHDWPAWRMLWQNFLDRRFGGAHG